ncbi:MAG: DNA polymerase IV [Deltaproteobacteria bacterium ADurb.Bin207]|nr:MAG: DNA polymerase IV [Deltaproteobacteria bacterium ADurb.Bin207]
MFSMPPRRITAIVLPHLLCELASAMAACRDPFAVILQDSAASQPLRARTRLDAVSDAAHRAGIRAGQSLAEAQAHLPCLSVLQLSPLHVQQTLARIAETALRFCPHVEISYPDALYLDMTGATHLYGSESSALHEVRTTVERLGHVARVAMAQGPRIAEMVARQGPHNEQVVAPFEERDQIQGFAISALPIDPAIAQWFTRVGVITLGDLLRLPRAQVTARLGDKAPELLDLAAGHDPRPLHAYTPAAVLCEQAAWEQGLTDLSALVFALHRLVQNMTHRLQGRGQALMGLRLILEHDPAIARFQEAAPESSTQVTLPVPIDRAEPLLRILRARLETLSLPAPVVGLRLETSQLVAAPRIQLTLSHQSSAPADALALLVAELSADLGMERVGTLALVDSYRPETRSCLHPPPLPSFASPPSLPSFSFAQVTQILPKPIEITKQILRPGLSIVLDSQSLRIEQMQFHQRLSGIEWWGPSSFNRDYYMIWLQNASTGGRGWFFRDRIRDVYYLHGWFD